MTHTATTTPAPELSVEMMAAAVASSAESTVEAGFLEVINTQGFTNATEISVETPLGTLTAVSLEDLLSSGSAAARDEISGTSGSKVSVPKAVAQDFPSGAALTILPWAGSSSAEANTAALADLATKEGTTLAAPIIDISVFGEDGRKLTVSALREPLLFKLPNAPNGTSLGDLTGAKCAYLASGRNSSSGSWSRQGVRRASDAEVLAAGQDPQGVWCVTEHLSVFSAIADTLLGCLNVELFSPEALRAVVSNEGWWRTAPAYFVWAIAASMLLCFLKAVAIDLWTLRLGQEAKEPMNIKICKKMMEWGPQVIKYRYTAFVVFTKDVLLCIWKGRRKLEKPTFIGFVQRCLVLRTGVSLSCVSQHFWEGVGWKCSEASLPHAVLCKKLEIHMGVLESIVDNEFARRGPHYALRRFAIVFLAGHPLLDAMRPGGGSLSSRKRVALQAATLFGIMAVNAMIFNFSGQVRGWESGSDCPISPTSMLFIVVATLVSIVINLYPNAFLAHLGRQTFARPGWNTFFWFLAACYLGGSATLLVASLANLHATDQDSWHESLRWVLCIKLLGMPGAQALRNFLMLEWFLTGDMAQRKHLLQAFGRRCKHEGEEEEERNLQQEDWVSRAERISRRSISAENLVKLLESLSDQQLLFGGQDVGFSSSEARLLSKSFAEAIMTEDPEQPTDRIVVHSRNHVSSKSSWGRVLDNCLGRVHIPRGDFLHLVVSVLADALGMERAYGIAQGFVARGDFEGLLCLLQERGCHRTRYWIDLFAWDLRAGFDAEGDQRCWLDMPPAGPGYCWHEEFLAVMPTLVRCMQRDCARAMVADLQAMRKPRCSHLRQLLVLDRDFLLIHEHFTLAELMLGAQMNVEQRMALHPAHLKGNAVRCALAELEEDEFFHTSSVRSWDATKERLPPIAKKAEDHDLENHGNVLPWLMPHLEDKELVNLTVQDLVIEGIKLATAVKEDDASIWQELHMADILPHAGARMGVRGSMQEDDGGHQEGDHGHAGGDSTDIGDVGID